MLSIIIIHYPTQDEIVFCIELTNLLVVFGLGRSCASDDLRRVMGLDKMSNQWEFQNPKMEALYHIGLYFGGVYALTWP